MDSQRKILAGMAGVFVIGGMGLAIAQKNFEFLYYGSTLIVIMLGVLLLDRRVRLPLFVLWGLMLWLILHLAGGMIKVPESVVDEGMTNYTLYNVRLAPWLPRYDQPVHAFGFFMSTLAGWRAIFVGSGRMLRPTFGPRVAAGLLGMGCGGVNEVIEFIATRIMPETNVGGYVNTGWDLVSNMVGCMLAMLLIRTMHEKLFTGP
jgi:hypothetical protein